MTLNGLKGHLTLGLYVHYYELPLTNYLLLIYCSFVYYTCDQRQSHLTNGEVLEVELQTVIRRIFRIRGKSADLPWTLYRRKLNK